MPNRITTYDANETRLATRFYPTPPFIPGSDINFLSVPCSDEEMEASSAGGGGSRRTFGRSYSMDTNSPAMPMFPPPLRSESPYSTISSASSQFVVPLPPPPIPSKNLHRANGLHRTNRSLHSATIM